MATELIVLDSLLAGASVGFSPIDASGNFFANDGATVLMLQNPTEQPANVEVCSQRACSFDCQDHIRVEVEPGETRVAGKFPRIRFNDDSGKVQVRYPSVPDGLLAAAVRLPTNSKLG